MTKIKFQIEHIESRGMAVKVKLAGGQSAVFLPAAMVDGQVATIPKAMAVEKMVEAARPVGFWKSRDGRVSRFYLGDDYIEHREIASKRDPSASYYDAHRVAKGDTVIYDQQYTYCGNAEKLNAALITATGCTGKSYTSDPTTDDKVSEALHGTFVNPTMLPAYQAIKAAL